MHEISLTNQSNLSIISKTLYLRKILLSAFKKKKMLEILIKIMCLLGIEITLTQAMQIIIVNSNYNNSLNNQAEKRISCIRIRQTNESISYICFCTDITIK